MSDTGGSDLLPYAVEHAQTRVLTTATAKAVLAARQDAPVSASDDGLGGASGRLGLQVRWICPLGVSVGCVRWVCTESSSYLSVVRCVVICPLIPFPPPSSIVRSPRS
jgi:hypothetical protein